MNEEKRKRLREAMAGFRAINLGKSVAERLPGGGFLVMTPDGQVKYRGTKLAVERLVERWNSDNLKLKGGDIGVGSIEWRNPKQEGG